MQGIYFIVFIVAILVVVHWAWKNDKIGPNEKSTGILKMSEMEDRKPPPAPPTRTAAQRPNVPPGAPHG